MDATAAVAEQFFPINLRKIYPQSIISFDLFLRAGQRFILYRSRNIIFTIDDIRRLLDNSVELLYIHQNDRKNFRTYVENHVEQVLRSEHIPLEKKAEVLYESAIYVVEDVFANPRAGETIQRSKRIVNNTVDFILSGPLAFVNLLRLREHDFYTYAHSVNVCTFLVALAQSMGVHDKIELKEVGEGGLLHDLGKSRVPTEILNKRGPLSAEEWQVVRQHPEFGVEIARQTRAVSEISLGIIGQHHERISGKGYPLGLAAAEVNLFSRMASIADVYDALTTNRPYSDALSPVAAAQLLLQGVDLYDQKVLEIFLKMLAVKR